MARSSSASSAKVRARSVRRRAAWLPRICRQARNMVQLLDVETVLRNAQGAEFLRHFLLKVHWLSIRDHALKSRSGSFHLVNAVNRFWQ